MFKYSVYIFSPSPLKVTHLSKKAHSKRLYYVRMYVFRKSAWTLRFGKGQLLCALNPHRDRVRWLWEVRIFRQSVQ